METVASSFMLYGACVIGAIGVAMALPRKGVSPQVIGGMIAATGGGLLLLAVLARDVQAIPNPFFYVFSLVAIGACLRVISHPKPVYAALYFILTILASAGLYLILSAEFMTFALVIVYAGAILITYLFVIMLATQAPSASELDALESYDRYSREPIVATVMGFVLLAALTVLMTRGSEALAPAGEAITDRELIVQMPRKVERELRRAGLIEADERIVRDEESGAYLLDTRGALVQYGDVTPRLIPASDWPASLQSPTNIERVGFDLLVAKPGAIEIAGIILLMAMLGAVVLSRKRIEFDEEEKLAEQARLSSESEGPGV